MTPAKLGQHWLIDNRVCKKIANTIGLDKTITCIEIGGGKGALTKHLLPLCKRLLVYEIDAHWAQHQRQLIPQWLELKDCDTPYEVRELDALKIDWNRKSLGLKKNEKVVVTGNLPYYITSPMLLRLAYSFLDIRDATFLIQREVAQRIAAKYGDSDYSRLTVSLGAFYTSRRLFNVEPDAFKPKPKVMSSVIKLTPHSNKMLDDTIVADFEKTVMLSFQMRRKKLRNNLLQGFPEVGGAKIDEIFSDLGISPNDRAQEISVEKFIELTRSLKSTQEL